MWESLGRLPLMEKLLSEAYFALGTFFVLSGFLLGLGYAGGNWDRGKLARYFAGRVARILPLYVFSLLIVGPIIYRQLREPGLGSPWQRTCILFDYLLLLQAWVKLPVDWNTPAWSLSCEVFFYGCFPLAAWWLARRCSSAAAVLAAAFGLPVLLHGLHLPPEWKPFAYLGDFIAGMGCARLYTLLVSGGNRLCGRGYLLYVPAAVTGLLVLLFNELLPWIVFDGVMRAVNAAVVLGLALGGGFPLRILTSPLVFSGGAASYAIYILHVPVLWWYRRAPIVSAVPQVVAGLLYVLSVLALAVAACRWIEHPAEELIRKKLGRRLPEIDRRRPALTGARALTAPCRED